MTKKKVLCTILSMLLVGTSICSVFAADAAAKLETSNETAVVGNMERISAPVDFEFEIISVGRDTVTAEFTSSRRISTPPYVGGKGTKNTAEKISNLQYVLEYDKEYSFVYSVTENGVETVYNSFLTVERGSDIKVVFGDIIKNEVSGVSTRAVGTKTEIESNNNYSSATRTYDDYDNYGALTSNTDVDWWVVSFLNSGSANFWLGNIPANCDYELELYASNGTTLLMSSENSGNTQELLTCPVEAGVNYYVKIYSYSGSSTSQYLFRTKNYPNIQDNKVYYIKSAVNNHCMTVQNGWNQNEMNVYTAAFNSNPSDQTTYRNNQRFRLIYDESGNYYHIAPVCSFDGFSSYYEGRVVDIDMTNGIVDYANVMTWWNNGVNEEKFSIVEIETGLYAIKLRYNSTFAFERHADGNVCINTYSGTTSQLWIIEEDTYYNDAEEYYLSLNWEWPMSFTNLSSSYGYRNLNGDKFHNGIDVPTGQTGGYPVKAAQSGTVHKMSLDTSYGCGYYLIVKTNDSVYSGDPNYSNKKLCYLYQHLQTYPYITYPELNVAGHQIQKGDPVALSGNSGMPDPKKDFHLHYTVITSESVVFLDTGYDMDMHFHDTFNPLAFHDPTSLTFDYYN